jgi:hypothetical protein
MGDEGTIITVGLMPAPWPVIVPVNLLEQDRDGTRVGLSAETDGRLVLSVATATGRRTRAFGPVHLPGGSRVILTICWSFSDLSLSLNDAQLGALEVFPETLGVPAQPAGLDFRERVFPSLRYRATLSREEEHLLRTLRDIDEKLVVGDRYSVLRASGLLRQLLMDGNPLVHVVSRKYRVQIVFRTLDFHEPVPVEPEAHWRVLDPSPFPGAKTTDCTLSQFLAAPCLKWTGALASVHDLISVCANAMGGVHLGKAKTSAEQVLLDWDEAVTVLGEQPSVTTIAGICRIVLRAMKPLVDALQEVPPNKPMKRTLQTDLVAAETSA